MNIRDKKKKFYKLVLMWIVSVCILALAYFSVVFPVYMLAKQKNGEAEFMYSKLQRKRKYAGDQNLNRLRDKRKILADTLNSFVAGNMMSSECTYAITKIASTANVDSFTTKQKTAKGLSEIQNCKLIRRYLVDVSFTGTYDKFLKLVNEYERSRPLVLIDKFTVTVNRDGLSDIEMSLIVLLDREADAGSL